MFGTACFHIINRYRPVEVAEDPHHLQAHPLSIRHRLVESHRDKLRNPLFLHRDAVKGVRRFHGSLVVRYNDKLSVVGEFPEDAGEPVDVAVIERRIDLVENAKGTRFHKIDGKEQCDSGERFLSSRQQVNRRRTFPPRFRHDLDAGFQRIDPILESQITFIAFIKETLERGNEILTDFGESSEELMLGRRVDFFDRRQGVCSDSTRSLR